MKAVIVALDFRRFIVSLARGKRDSFRIRCLTGAFSLSDLNVIIRGPASAFRRWSHFDANGG